MRVWVCVLVLHMYTLGHQAWRTYVHLSIEIILQGMQPWAIIFWICTNFGYAYNGYILDTFFWIRLDTFSAILDTFGYVWILFLDTRQLWLPTILDTHFFEFWIRPYSSISLKKLMQKMQNASIILDTGIQNDVVLDTKIWILDTRVLFERECRNWVFWIRVSKILDIDL